jgi:hypothetical protein
LGFAGVISLDKYEKAKLIELEKTSKKKKSVKKDTPKVTPKTDSKLE